MGCSPLDQGGALRYRLDLAEVKQAHVTADPEEKKPGRSSTLQLRRRGKHHRN